MKPSITRSVAWCFTTRTEPGELVAAATDTRKDAASNVASVAANADSSSKDLNEANSRAAYDVAVAQADGAYGVTIERYSALTEGAQKSCKERADASLDLANTHANVVRLSKLQWSLCWFVGLSVTGEGWRLQRDT